MSELKGVELNFSFSEDLNINKSYVNIPEYLANRTIKEYDAKCIKDCFAYLNISTFSELNIDLLNQYAKIHYDNALQANTLLGLYGVEFIGKSSKKFSPNSRNLFLPLKTNCLNIDNIYQINFFKAKFKYIELTILNYFESIGLNNIKQIDGINLSILLDKLNLYDLDVEEIINDLDSDYITIAINEVWDCSLNIKEKLKDTDINYELPISALNLSTKAKNSLYRINISNLGQLINIDLELYSRQRNIGTKTIDEVIEFLDNKKYMFVQNINCNITEIQNKNPNQNVNYNENVELPLDERIYNLDVECLRLSKKINSIIIESKICTIGKLLESINNLKLSKLDKISIYEKLETYGINRESKYYPAKLLLPESYYYPINEIFNDDWICDACKKHNIKNIGLLAYNYPQVFVEDDVLASQNQFFDKLKIIENKLIELQILNFPVNLSIFQLKDLNKKILREMIDTQYYNLLVESITFYLEFDGIMMPNGIKPLSKKEVDVIKRRHGLDNEPPKTLAEIGVEYGCTRERIRQLEAKGIGKILKYISEDLSEYNDELQTVFDNLGSLVFNNSVDADVRYYTLIRDVFEKFSDGCFEFDIENNLIKKRDFDINSISQLVLEELQNQEYNEFTYLELETVFKNNLRAFVQNETELQVENFNKIFAYLFPLYLEKYGVEVDKNKYQLLMRQRFKDRQARNKKMIYWFEQLYPKGVHLPIDNDNEVQENLKLLLEKCPEMSGFNIRAMVDNILKQEPEIIWWDRGTYIHINNTHADLDVVNFAIEKTIEKFNNGFSRIKIDAIFNEHQDKYIAANIPNSTALVGLIKYKNHPRIDIHRFELRDRQNFNAELNMLESFEEFISKFSNGISKVDLIDEMCNKRGWKPYQIEFLYSRSDKIFKNGNLYLHQNCIKINKEKMDELIKLISNEINKNQSSFHLRKIQLEYPVTWSGVLNQDISSNFMGRLLNNVPEKDFIIDNYVYVKYKDTNDNINFKTLLSNFIEEESTKREKVTIDEMMMFCQKQGVSDLKQHIENRIVDFCFQYGENSYVHNNVLGYSDDFQADIAALIQLLEESKNPSPIFRLEDIINNYKEILPELNDGYEWNIYLLRSAFQKFEILDVFDKTFIFKENRFGVEDLDDTAAYLILKTYEEGYCTFKQLDKLLAQYDITPYKQLHFYKSRLFFEGSSIKLVDESLVAVENFAKEKYLKCIVN